MEVLADSMLIIDKGRKVAGGRVAELLNPADTLVEVQTTDTAAAIVKLNEGQWTANTVDSNGRILLRLHKNDIPGLIKYLTDSGIALMGVQQKHTLEDYFLSLTTANQHVAAYQN
jgi:ABC-type multidrug transport system ATPase subunit